jgi:hypothetical protein
LQSGYCCTAALAWVQAYLRAWPRIRTDSSGVEQQIPLRGSGDEPGAVILRLPEMRSLVIDGAKKEKRG